MSSSHLVVLPSWWNATVVTDPDNCDTLVEQRSVERVRVLKEADLTITYTPQLLQHLSKEIETRSAAGALVKDMSTAGIGFLYHVQLYPKEKVTVKFRGHLVEATIRRCRYLGPSCYEHGAHILCVKRLSPPS